jgi:hypothetical protein
MVMIHPFEHIDKRSTLHLFKSSMRTGGVSVLRVMIVFGPDNPIAGVLVCAPEIIARPPCRNDFYKS